MKGMNQVKHKQEVYIALLVSGIALVYVGGFALEGIVSRALSGICIGIGSGLFGMSIANLVTIRIMKKHPEIERKIKIDAKDERTLRINNMARAKAFAITQILYAVLVIVLALMGENLLIILLVWGVFMLGWVFYFVYFAKYAKEM